MFDAIPQAQKSKLWKHQLAAVDFAIKHLSELDSPCLIRMPTGTGKTGVIACLTRLSNQGSSLVLTPWAHLRNQIVADLEKGFWEKTNIAPNPTSVVSMYPSKAERMLKDAAKKVIVKVALWNKLKSDIIGSSNPELFVVLVTAGCCDLQELKQAAANADKRTPEIAQLLHLLVGLNGYARQLGVRLILRDLPYQN